MATIRTFVLEILRLCKVDNMIAQMELFKDDFDELIRTLKKIRFLQESPFIQINEDFIFYNRHLSDWVSSCGT